jgi:recombinational DNA repair protein RecR
MLSAAHLTIVREAYQMIKKEDYRILELTEQILDITHRVMYCVVCSSVHFLGEVMVA